MRNKELIFTRYDATAKRVTTINANDNFAGFDFNGLKAANDNGVALAVAKAA